MADQPPAMAMPGWLQWVLSAGAGGLVALVAFRTRFALLEGKVEANRVRIEENRTAQATEFQRLEERIESRLAGIDRRQTMILQVVADIAHKVGVDARLGDTVVRFLADEANQSRGRLDG